MNKIVDTLWFTDIGIVKVETIEGYKYYIGNCVGYNEDFDAQRIADFGYPVYPEQIKKFMGF